MRNTHSHSNIVSISIVMLSASVVRRSCENVRQDRTVQAWDSQDGAYTCISHIMCDRGVDLARK